MLRNPFVSVRRNAEVFSKVGMRSSRPPDKKSFRSGQHFIHSELAYRGIVLYPWEGATVTADGVSEKTMFYQVLVDQRDAEECPMEHELLRISDSDHDSFEEFVPTRFRNWDLVPHEEIIGFQRDDAEMDIKHHLIHHFLKTFYSYSNNGPTWEVRRTPTLNYWIEKFSSVPIVCHVADVDFGITTMSVVSKTDEHEEKGGNDMKDSVMIRVIPYHLTTNNVQNFNHIGHLTRFSCEGAEEYEVCQRSVIAENKMTGEICESKMNMNISLGGDKWNSIYQHSRHVEIPHGESHLIFSYRVRRLSDEKEHEIMLSAFTVSSTPKSPDSDI